MKVYKYFLSVMIISAIALPFDITIYQSGRAHVSKVYRNLGPIEKSSSNEFIYIISDLPDKINTNSILIDTDIGPIGWHRIYRNSFSMDMVIENNISQKVTMYIRGKEDYFSALVTILNYNKNTGDILYLSKEGKEYIVNKKDINAITGMSQDYSLIHTGPTLELNSGRSRLNKISLSYIVPSISWQPEYNLLINSPTRCSLESAVRFINNSGKDFEDANITLMHGDIKLPRNEQLPSEKRLATRKSFSIDETGTDDHGAYVVRNNFNFLDDQLYRQHYYTLYDIDYSKIYSFTHTLSKRSKQHTIENLKSSIMYRLSGNKLGDYSYPMGLIKVYEVSDNSLTLVGSDNFEIVDKNSNIDIYTGTTSDVVADFMIVDCKDLRSNSDVCLKATFANNSDKKRGIEWTEYIYGDYTIINQSIEGNQLDANRIRFSFSLDANESISHTLEIKVSKK